MWFDDEVISGKKLGTVKKRGRTPILNVRKGGKKGDGGRFHKLAAVILVVATAVLLVGLSWYGVKWMGTWLFAGNDRFTITRIAIKNDAVAAHDFIRGEKKINEGTNLFAFDIDELQKEFLERATSYKAIRITRFLPDTLTVEVEPRIPVARVGRWSSLVTDNDGVVFPAPGRTKTLPTISGYRKGELAPGTQMRGQAIAAIQLVSVCDNPRLGLAVEAVDVGNAEHIEVKAKYGGRSRSISLTWEGMGIRSADTRLKLLRKLGRWVQVMQSEAGMNRSRFDGTYPGRIYAL